MKRTQVPGVTTMEGWFQAEGVPLRADGSEGDSVVVSALPADTEIFVPDMVGGRWLEPEDTNAIVVPASLLSAEPGLGLGEGTHAHDQRRGDDVADRGTERGVPAADCAQDRLCEPAAILAPHGQYGPRQQCAYA